MIVNTFHFSTERIQLLKKKFNWPTRLYDLTPLGHFLWKHKNTSKLIPEIKDEIINCWNETTKRSSLIISQSRWPFLISITNKLNRYFV